MLRLKRKKKTKKNKGSILICVSPEVDWSVTRYKSYVLNPKHEYLNPKQIQNINDQMFKTIPTHLPVAVLEFVF